MTPEQPAGVEWTDQIPPNSADPSLSEGPATNGAESPGEPRSNRLIKALNLAVDECARALIERDEALAERDRARATAVRLEQELAEMTEAASVAIGMALVSQAREAELQEVVTERLAKALEALPRSTARDREGRE